MADRTRGRGRLLLVALLALVVVPADLARADELVTTEPIRFEAGEGTTFELHDGRRFVDTVEVRLAPDGSPILVNELSMDDYLTGVAEMPPRWHGEALKAQAVAARTYAWRSVLRGTFRERGLGYDICGTVDCQVFRGAAVVEESSHGERWRAAVRVTSGEVLLDDGGAPILARYFSTSGGRTVPNELVFPESGSHPYLVGGEDPDDAIAPLHRWRVEFTRDEFDDVLSRGETLAAAVPVAEVARDGDLHDPHARIVVTGEDGTRVAVTARDLREFVSRVAPDRHPDRFPSLRDDGLRRLPATLPSSRFTVEVTDDAVLVEGRGWGHGVGMGQYGARGKALRGMGYEDILASYYNGLRPRVSDGLVERVRVGLDVDDEIGIRADGAFRVVADDEVVAERALGGWRVEATGDGLRMGLPEADGPALEVSATEVAWGDPRQDDHVIVEASVNKPAEVSLVVADADGGTVRTHDLGVRDPGTHTAVWRFEDDDGDRVAEGDYAVAVVAVDAEGTRAGEPVELAVPAPPDDGPSDAGATSPAAGSDDGAGGDLPGRVAAALAALVVLAVVTVGTLRRRRA